MAFEQQFPNPYDQTTPNLQPETIPIHEIIRQAFISQMLKIRICMPASVTEVLGDQKVSIQPLLKSRYTDQTVVEMPVIQNVPVRMPMGENYSIKYPIAVGDTGYVIISDRSLDKYLQSTGGMVDPEDSRQHYLQDAIFEPGLVTFPNQTTDGSKDLVFNLGLASEIRLMLSGIIKIGKNAGHGVGLGDNIENRLETIENALTQLTSVFGATHTHPVISLGSPTGPPTPIASPFTPNTDPAASETIMVTP